eukprot:Clim_evm11s250 gene=Clim_evmTU11s250
MSEERDNGRPMAPDEAAFTDGLAEQMIKQMGLDDIGEEAQKMLAQMQAGGTLPEGTDKESMDQLRQMIAQYNEGQGKDATPDKEHKFWKTQPVPQFTDPEKGKAGIGAIEDDKAPDEIRQEPYKLPSQFVWDTVDITDEAQLTEVYDLLYGNYVEDDDAVFRFDYSRPFLKWALCPPGWEQLWHCGVRVQANKKLVAFISAIPADVHVVNQQKRMVEVNFLCVHKKLRTKRLAPVLIKEITRRVHIKGIFQAIYTGGIVIPRPVTRTTYWHRSLNFKKLVDTKFSYIPRNQTMQRMLKLYKLPKETHTTGLRQMTKEDVPEVQVLLRKYLSNKRLVPVMNEDEVAHWLLPRDDVVETYVVQNPDSKKLTDFISFYILNSSVLNNDKHSNLKVAYCFYYAPFKHGLKDLLRDMLIVAKNEGCDVFNALDIMDNQAVFADLNFGKGDGNLQYYLYNFYCPEMKAQDCGFVLL